MRLLQKTTSADAALIANAAFTLGIPPAQSAVVPAEWNARASGGAAVPEIDFEFWANAAINLTAAELFAASGYPLVVADTHPDFSRSSLNLATKTTHCDTVVEAVEIGAAGSAVTIAFVADGAGQGTLNESAYPAIVYHYATGVSTNANFEAKVAASVHLRVKTASASPATALVAVVDAFGAAHLAGGVDNVLVRAAHGHLLGDGPFNEASSGSLPTGLPPTTDVWVIKVDANSYKLAASLQDALSGTPIALSGDATGALTEADEASTARLIWLSHGLLGPAGDGAITLDVDKGYMCTRPHRSRVLAYAVSATLSVSDPEAVSVAMFPVEDR